MQHIYSAQAVESVDLNNSYCCIRGKHLTEEILAHSDLTESQIESLKAALRYGELNKQLGPYPFEQHHKWINLTNFMTSETLDKAGCAQGVLLS